jgi:O-antigen/teichoic acid export membrane protein
MMGSQFAGTIFLVAILVRRRFLNLAGLIGSIRAEAPFLLKNGSLFFILQLGTMVAWGADSLIIAATLGAAHVATYNIAQRLFQFTTQPLAIMNGPLWGAYADARARGDKLFIRTTIGRSFKATALFALVGVSVTLLLYPWAAEKLTAGTVVIPASFVVVYALWIPIEACGNCLAMLLNGAGIIRQQVATAILFIAIALPLKLYLVHVLGLPGILLATIVAYLISHVGLYGFVFREQIRKEIC